MIRNTIDMTINNNKYRFLVHCFTDKEDFCTMYRNGEFIHKSLWNEEEKSLSEKYIKESANINPIKTIWVNEKFS